MKTFWQKYLEELLQDEKTRYQTEVSEQQMVQYLQNLLPSESSKVANRKAKRAVRLMRR